MSRHIRLLGIFLTVACATTHPAPGPPILSPAVDVDSLLPAPPPPVVIPEGLPVYEDIPVRAGRCPGLPRGVLVSEPYYAANIRAYLERDRLRAEVGVLHKLRKEEREGCESLLQSQRLELVLVARQAAQDARWATFKLAVGIGLGVAAGFAAGRLGSR